MNEFSHGPFSFDPGQRLMLAGESSRAWKMRYGSTEVAMHTLPDISKQSGIIEAFSADIALFIRSRKPTPAPALSRKKYEVALCRSTENTGEVGPEISSFRTSLPIPGLTAGLIDDRYETWAITSFGNMPMNASEFERLAAAHAVSNEALDKLDAAELRLLSEPARSWIAGMLPAEVMTSDPNAWRAPTSWEIRHVVGEGSFTGLSGAKAAELVGVTPQNFRKYTAQDGAKTRQNMSYAMWHLLLHRLGVKCA